MGDLPKDWVTSCHLFEVVGVDLCGPIYTTINIRGRKKVKSYVAVIFQQHSKLLVARSNMKEGGTVVFHEDNLPPM